MGAVHSKELAAGVAQSREHDVRTTSHAVSTGSAPRQQQEEQHGGPRSFQANGRAAVAEALSGIGECVRSTTHLTNLQKLQLLGTLGLEDDMEEETEDMMESLFVAGETVDSALGDAKKYKALVLQMTRRWRLFLALYQYEDITQPTVQMAKEFTIFMAHARQRRSSAGREGVGDSVAEAAQKTLAQFVFKEMGYADWTELSEREAREKAVPYRDTIKDTWQRLKRAKPELQLGAKPFVKGKWDERAYFIVQDFFYAEVDAGRMSANAGLTKLAVLALIRITCSRPGAVGKDAFDLNGTIAKWSRDGENVLDVADLEWAREGLRIELGDGTVEEASLRAQLEMTRIKAFYEDAAAGGYEYQMSLTADTAAVPRRATTILATYQWRRGLFAVQYDGMTRSEIAEAVSDRAENGYGGGMPENAKISAEEAVKRFNAGEMAYLPELKKEPLLVMLSRGGDARFTTKEISTAAITNVFQEATVGVGFKPGSGGVNNLRRQAMSDARSGAEKQGYDSAMHAKRLVNHRSAGHKQREGTYEDATSSQDVPAFLMDRKPEKIESLKSLSSKRVPALAKYKTLSDVPQRDPKWKLVTESDELKKFSASITRYEQLMVAEPENESYGATCKGLMDAERSLRAYLTKSVLHEKRKEVYERGVLELETMPLKEVQARHEVNSFEGVTVPMIMLHYGSSVECDLFTPEAIVAKKKAGRTWKYLMQWRGYKDATWEPSVNVEATLIREFEGTRAVLGSSFKPEPAMATGSKVAAVAVAAAELAVTAASAISQVEKDLCENLVDEAMSPKHVTALEKVREVQAEAMKALEGAMARTSFSTPRPSTILSQTPMAPSRRVDVQAQEEVMAGRYRELRKMKPLKADALRALAMELAGDAAPMSMKTLRHKVDRAEKRLGQRGIHIKFKDKELTVKYGPNEAVHSLTLRLACLLGKDAAKLRLCIDGERVFGAMQVADVVSGAADSLIDVFESDAHLDVFEEVAGGGGSGSGSQQSPVQLSPGGTEADELEAGGTQPEGSGTPPPPENQEVGEEQAAAAGSPASTLTEAPPAELAPWHAIFDEEEPMAPPGGAASAIDGGGGDGGSGAGGGANGGGGGDGDGGSDNPVAVQQPDGSEVNNEEEDVVEMVRRGGQSQGDPILLDVECSLESLAKLKERLHSQLADLPGSKRPRSAMCPIDSNDTPSGSSYGGGSGDGGGGYGNRSGSISTDSQAGGGVYGGGVSGGGVGGGGGGASSASSAAERRMEAQLAERLGTFKPNAEQSKVLDLLGRDESVETIGDAGTGKTTVMLEFTRRRLAAKRTRKVLIMAPFNTHVTKIYEEIAKDAYLLQMLKQRRIVLKTAAAACSFPLDGMAKASTMQRQMSASMLELWAESELAMVIDEGALITCFKRDELQKFLKGLRANDAPDGGVVCLGVQDPLQGKAILSKEEEASCTVNGVMLRELNIEGDYIKNRHVVFLTKSTRFVGPLKETYEAGAKELRGGGTGRAAQELVNTALNNKQTAEVALESVTVTGTSKEVMDLSIRKTLARAAARGHTVANGGVYIFKNTEANAMTEPERNKFRPFGFEHLVIAKGEKMLLVQKAKVRKPKETDDGTDIEEESESDEDEESESLQFKDKSYAHGNMTCIVVDFKPGRWIKVRVPSRRAGKDELVVPLGSVTVGGRSLDLFPLKPFMERVVDLAQGLEWTGPVLVDATHIYGCGKFYVAMTRCRDLRMLSLEGLPNGYKDLRRVVRSNWRAIDFHVKHGQEMPASSRRYAAREKQKFLNITSS